MLLKYLLILISALATSVAVYQLLPAIACRLKPDLATAVLFRPGNRSHLTHEISCRLLGFLPSSWRKALSKWLGKAGYQGESAIAAYMAMMVLPVPIFWLGGKIVGLSGNHGVWIALVCMSLINSKISSRIKQRRRIFTRSLYKIYRFMDLQISSGVKVTDAVRGLPEAIEDHRVKPSLVRFSARYELTLNVDQAMDEIRCSFPGTDCEMLATHLRHCLQTGIAGRSFVRMEELLFSRYFNLMQQDTKRIRTELLVVAITGMFPGIIIFLYPLLFEAAKAMESVFGSF